MKIFKYIFAFFILIMGIFFYGHLSAPQETIPEETTPKIADSVELEPAVVEPPVYTFEEVSCMAACSQLDESMLTEELMDSLFYETEITEDIRSRIWNISYKENNHISLDDLRYLRVLHCGPDDGTYIGELLVNKAIASDILDIMKELYLNDYPIEKMILIDAYDADDVASMEDNNTSAFNYRLTTSGTSLSRHGLGMAIDINPKYNPYVKGNLISPESSAEYVDRSADFPYKIDSDDLAVRLFKEKGFDWGGDWRSSKDYQHFEK